VPLLLSSSYTPSQAFPTNGDIEPSDHTREEKKIWRILKLKFVNNHGQITKCLYTEKLYPPEQFPCAEDLETHIENQNP